MDRVSQCYTGPMQSVADSLRDDTRRKTLALPPEERIQRALALGDADIAAMCEARDVTTAEARVIIARSRRQGRRLSRANAD